MAEGSTPIKICLFKYCILANKYTLFSAAFLQLVGHSR